MAKTTKKTTKKKSKSTVNKAGNYTKPEMRKRLFNRIKAGGKGGAPGQWSARKAQMLASAYKKQEVGIATKKKRDPKVGTGKKPKGSGRRLYTDENPKDTVSIKFATPTDARNTVRKVKKVNKSYARKIQILTVGEQRAKVMGKTEVVAIFKKAKESLKRANERKKKKV